MKKIPHNKKYTEIAIYVVVTAFALMVLWRLVNSSENLWYSLSDALAFVAKSFRVVIAGLILGYILSPAVDLMERGLRRVFKKKESKKSAKRIYNGSVAIVFVMLIVIVVLLITFVIPPLVTNVVQLSESMPEYVEDITKWYDDNLRDSQLFTSEYTRDIVDSSRENIFERLNQIVLLVITKLATSIWAVVRSLLNIVIALFIAIYYVLVKKKLTRDTVELARLRFGEERTRGTIDVLKATDWVFGRYISAKLLQALIIFVTSLTILLILDVNFATLLAVILAICNIVPYIGAFIGIIPPIIVALLQDPSKALWVAIAMLSLQILDGNVLQPIIIGDKMGIKPFWVIVAVILGGNWFGLWGILLSVPVAAVIRIFIQKYVIERRKGVSRSEHIKP